MIKQKDIDDKSICLIGLDIGTSAIKGVLVRADGKVLAEAGTETAFLHPEEGQVEIEPERHYENVCGVIRRLAASAPCRVAALSMAAASGNTLLTDSEARPLCNIISWMDQRAVRQAPKPLAEISSAELAQICGWPCVNSFPLAHLAWLRENRSEIYYGAGHYGMDTDWLIFRLTGKWVMDHSTASTFHLQEQVSGNYHLKFLDLLEIPMKKLSPLLPSASAVGSLLPQSLRDTGLSPETILVSGCFDHPAAARASGILKSGQLMLSCGTSWVGFTPVTDRKRIIDAEMLCDPFLSRKKGPWGGIFSVPYIGRAIDWYVNNVIAPNENDRMRIFNESAAEAGAGANGLEIDLRLAPKRIEAERKNISRAVMEGAARLIKGKITELKRHGFNFDQAVMVGGPTQSPIWPGITAEITGMEVTTGSMTAGAQGAAILAGIGIGIYRDEYAALAARR